MIADINLERGDMARTTNSKLLIGLVLLPIFYFGMQLLLAPYFPGYSLLRDATSILGSDRSPVAHWFNVLAIVGGLLGIVGAFGAYRVLSCIDPGKGRAIVLPVVMALVALGSVWAGAFPMPHPLHPKNPATPAMLLMPVVALVYTWWSSQLRSLRPAAIINLIFFLLLIPFMAGLLPVDRTVYGGLLQRLLALPVFVPIGLIGWYLRSIR